MNHRTSALCVGLLLAVAPVYAAPAAWVIVDHSTETLVDRASAKAAWNKALSARVAKLYPPKKWGFASEVEGGFNAAKICVVTARAMMLPVTASGKYLRFKPEKTATAFDALPGATQEQCKQLARAKLDEAIGAVVGGLTAN
jgi:hypothetical protein